MKRSRHAAAAIQCVIYLRGVFPEEAFGEGEICGVSIRRLNPEGSIAEARQFLRYLDEGVMSAIKLNVLSSVELLFQTEQARGVCAWLLKLTRSKDGPVVERYVFAVAEGGALSISSGREDGAAAQQTRARETNDAVRVMLRKLLVTTDALTPMHTGCIISLRLVYKEGTPPEFEPLHFRAGGHELRLPCDSEAAMDLHLGHVEAGAGRALEFTFQSGPDRMRQDEPSSSPSSCSRSSVSSPAPAKRPRC